MVLYFKNESISGVIHRAGWNVSMLVAFAWLTCAIRALMMFVIA